MLLFLTAAASLLDDRSLVLKRQQADQILLFCGMYFILWLLLDSFNDYFFSLFSVNFNFCGGQRRIIVYMYLHLYSIPIIRNADFFVVCQQMLQFHLHKLYRFYNED